MSDPRGQREGTTTTSSTRQKVHAEIRRGACAACSRMPAQRLGRGRCGGRPQSAQPATCQSWSGKPQHCPSE
eukprot:3805697-Pyramimonas_sp.AAC.1